MTGLTDKMRKNFGLMRDLSAYTRLKAMDRMDRCQALPQLFSQSDEAQQEIARWETRLQHEPLSLTARKFDAGKEYLI